MTKIEAFIDKIKNDTIPVSALLRDAKLFATGLDQKDFVEWLNSELEGYVKASQYPTYRTLRGQMKAWNPFYGWVPVVHKSSEVEERLCTRSARQSIREIEELLSNKSDTYEMPYSSSLANQIIEGDFKTKISMFIGRSALVGILEAVRNKLLDWAAELQRKGIYGDQIKFSSEEKKVAKEIEERFNIGNIENFHGNLGNDGNYKNENDILTPTESFWSKAFWYIFVALIVVIVGNVLSALILKFFFQI